MTLIDQLNNALEQVALLKAQNGQLETLNTRHVESLEQVIEERDAARKELESPVKLRETLRAALEAWERNPESAAGDTTDVIQLRCKVLVAYRAARDGGAA